MNETEGFNENVSRKNNNEKVDYDHLLASAGEFGVYQILLFLSTMPFYIFGAFTYFSQLFLTEVAPNHWCWIPELANLTAIERRNMAIPNDTTAKFGYSQCTAYVANWSEVLNQGINDHGSWKTVPCQHGWEFNTTEIPYPTISSEMGWVCERSGYQATAQSIFFVGSIVGGFLVGWVADRFGRLPGAAFANIIGCVAGVASSFTQDFTQFAFCRFIMGMAYDNCMIMTYILLLEYVAPRYRALSANAPFAIFFTLGLCILPWISLACGHWRTISLATSIPLGLALLAPFVLPESPRWLLTKGRIDDAVNKAITIARINRKEIPTKKIEQFRRDARKQQEEHASILELFRRPLLRVMFICICILYMLVMIIFDALVRSVGHLDFDFFLSFTITSLTECPSLLIISFILDWTGRKRLIIIACSICGVVSILGTFVGTGLPSVICAVLARFFTNMAGNTSMQWAAEVLPAPVRGSGSSIVHVCGYIGTTISPFIVYLDVFKSWLPMLIVGILSFFAVAISLVLPETTGADMPQTFDDSENLMKTVNIFNFTCRKRNNCDEINGHVNESFEMNT